MTEVEAKQKRCCGPDGCGWPNGHEVVNTAGQMLLIPTRWCIGSDCMAWRITNLGQLPVKSGYCGLVGKP